MGWAHEHNIERAGIYLLSLLAVESEVPYARFYDGTDETHDKLLSGMGYPTPDNPDYMPDGAETHMDLAVAQLEDAGLVTTHETDEELADGEPAYDIKLTAAGRKFIDKKETFKYRGVDL